MWQWLHSIPCAGHQLMPSLCGKWPTQFLHTLIGCLVGWDGGFFFGRLLANPCVTLLGKRDLLRKRGWFDSLCNMLTGWSDMWELSPSNFLACSSVRSSDLSWLTSSWREKLARYVRLRRRLSLVLWIICALISSAALWNLQSDAFVFNRW